MGILNNYCPQCGSQRIHEMKDVKITGFYAGKPLYGKPEAYYECEDCNTEWERHDKSKRTFT
jgi:transposase-like protein